MLGSLVFTQSKRVHTPLPTYDRKELAKQLIVPAAIVLKCNRVIAAFTFALNRTDCFHIRTELGDKVNVKLVVIADGRN